MASYTTNINVGGSILRGLAAPFVAIGNFLVAISEGNSRLAEVKQLNALSDVQLAQRGLKREDIVRHVFRDAHYI